MGPSMNYKISIIVIVFNVENYLEDALESIVRQSIGLANLEVIMVDDCSTDSSGHIIDTYAAKYENFKSIHLPKNSGGCARPRNAGMEYISGEYVMFLDSDDYYSDDMCEILYDAIKQDNADIAFSNYLYVYPDTEQKYSFIDYEIHAKSIYEDTNLLKIPPSIWTKIYKTKFIEDNNLRFTEEILAEDLVFVVDSFLKANKITYLNDYFGYNYRIRSSPTDGSLSRDKNRNNLLGIMKGYYKSYNILKENDKLQFFSLIFSGHLQFWIEGFIMSDMNYSEKLELLKKIKTLFQEYEKYDIRPKEFLIPIYTLINNEKYDAAIVLSEVLKDYLTKNDKLRNLAGRLEDQEKFKKKIKDLEEENIQLKDDISLSSNKFVDSDKKNTNNDIHKSESQNVALNNIDTNEYEDKPVLSGLNKFLGISTDLDFLKKLLYDKGILLSKLDELNGLKSNALELSKSRDESFKSEKNILLGKYTKVKQRINEASNLAKKRNERLENQNKMLIDELEKINQSMQQTLNTTGYLRYKKRNISNRLKK
jgi:glycosyltransferase involved in cell wall biosynthesis